MDLEDERARAAIVEGELLRRELVEVVDPDSEQDTAAWMACDLAAMVEGCFQARVDPWALEPPEVQRWLDRLADTYEAADPGLDRAFLRYLWLLDGGERVGTLALPRSSAGQRELPLWSLYVHPSARGRGVAAGVLKAAHRAAREVGLQGLRIDTHWVWQRSVRFYLTLGMWVTGWKRAISFSWLDELPSYSIDEDEDRLTLAVDGRTPWLTATRRTDGLELTEHGALAGRPDTRYAHATMALALATRGWPLVRSEADWARRHASTDVGEVEGLAFKIQIFEALARCWGWEVDTPRIPGLAYPPLGAIE